MKFVEFDRAKAFTAAATFMALPLARGTHELGVISHESLKVWNRFVHLVARSVGHVAEKGQKTLQLGFYVAAVRTSLVLLHVWIN